MHTQMQRMHDTHCIRGNGFGTLDIGAVYRRYSSVGGPPTYYLEVVGVDDKHRAVLA